MINVVKKIIFTICMFIIIILLYGFTLVSIFNYKKGRYSEEEKRYLLDFPSIKYEDLISGMFSEKFDKFITDNVLNRTKYTSYAKKIKNLYSINNIIKDDTIIFINNNIDIVNNDINTKKSFNQFFDNHINGNLNEDKKNDESNIKHKSTEINGIDVDSNQDEFDYGENTGNTKYILYKGKPYNAANIYTYQLKYTAGFINKIKNLFKNSRFCCIPAPSHSIILEDEKVIKAIGDQDKAINDLLEMLDKNIVKINLTNIFREHKDEYLYYYSDHHWTGLGCYYAYYEYCKKMGIEPHELSYFKEITMDDKYIGSAYGYTKDERLKNLYDIPYWYMPRAYCTMEVVTYTGQINTYSSAIPYTTGGYNALLTGNHPLCKLTMRNKDNKDSLLIIKDSYGNGMVPYLTEHYNEIVVVDTRRINISIDKYLALYNVDMENFKDILICASFDSFNTDFWMSSVRRVFKIDNRTIYSSLSDFINNFLKEFYAYAKASFHEDINEYILDDYNTFIRYVVNSKNNEEEKNRIIDYFSKYLLEDKATDDFSVRFQDNSFVGYAIFKDEYIRFIKNAMNYYKTNKDLMRLIIDLYLYRNGDLPFDLATDSNFMKIFYYSPLIK